MATAKVERQMVLAGKGCLGKAADDEYVFVLRGKDRWAPWVVRVWACLARITGCPRWKVREAFDCARAMARTPNRKFPD